MAISISRPAVFMGAKAHRTAAQTISNATDTVLLWTAEEYDTNSIHDTSSNTGRFTVPTGGSGIWRFTVNILWAANSSNQRDLYLRKNGTTRLQEVTATNAGSLSTAMCLSLDILLADADYVEALVWQNSTGNLDVTVSSSNPCMSCQRLG